MLPRPKILWFGGRPKDDDHREAKNRLLQIDYVEQGFVPDFRFARAAVFWAARPDFAHGLAELKSHLEATIDAGLLPYIVVDTPTQINAVERILNDKLPKLPAGIPESRYRLRTTPLQHHEAPNEAFLHSPGPSGNASLVIHLPPGITLSDNQELLLRRAFHDCKSVEMELITGGLSGAMTFLVSATLSDSNAGARPMPFFAKIHKSDRLQEELKRYKQFAEYHIAFHLRPNFVADRCLFGVANGILVGNFVQESRSLLDAALNGQGPRYIQTLFTDTLAVLRSEMPLADGAAVTSVVEALEPFCQYWRIPAERIKSARLLGGEVHDSDTLWHKLVNLPPRPWRRCAIHGDMHGDNVRVRKDDAIVIDFAHAAQAPASADLASLEVWLSFRRNAADSPAEGVWRTEMEELYHPNRLLTDASASEPAGATGWLRDSVREIRRIASASTHSADEYARVLAVYLLRHASFPADEGNEADDVARRTYAYWLANRLIMALCETTPELIEEAA